MTIDHAGTLYVADDFIETIRKVSLDGVVTTLAGSGKFGGEDGTGPSASFTSPTGVAVDGAGNVFVADKNNNSIRRITPDGVVTTFAGMTGFANSGSIDATGAAARFDLPAGITIDPA